MFRASVRTCGSASALPMAKVALSPEACSPHRTSPRCSASLTAIGAVFQYPAVKRLEARDIPIWRSCHTSFEFGRDSLPFELSSKQPVTKPKQQGLHDGSWSNLQVV